MDDSALVKMPKVISPGKAFMVWDQLLITDKAVIVLMETDDYEIVLRKKIRGDISSKPTTAEHQ